MTSVCIRRQPNSPAVTNADNKADFRYPPVKLSMSPRTSRPVLKDMSNTMVAQAMESRRYIIEQPDIDAPSPNVPPSPQHESHVRGPSYEKFCPNVTLSPIRKNALPIGPVTKPASVNPVTSLGVSRRILAAHLPLSLDSIDFHLQLQTRHPLVNSDKCTLRRSSSLKGSPSLSSLPSSWSTKHLDCRAHPSAGEEIIDRGVPSSAGERRGMTRGNSRESGIHTTVNRNRDEAKEYRFPIIPTRTSTPPLSPPPPSGPSMATGLSKRSGRCFRLVPTKVDGEDKFMHAVAAQLWPRVDEAGKPNFASVADGTDLMGDCSHGMPLDMFQTLGHLEGIAAVVKGLPYPRARACGDFQPEGRMHYSGLGGRDDSSTTLRPSTPGISTTPTWTDKGKWRATAPSNKSKEAVVEIPPTTKTKNAKCITGRLVSHQETMGCVYNPQLYRTPEFLIGSSESPIVSPTSGYHSPPKHYTMDYRNPSLISLSDPSTDHSSTSSSGSFNTGSKSSGYASRRSASGTRPPLSAPPGRSNAGASSLKAFFNRSRGNTTVVACASTIPLSHLPVESSVSRERRARLPWLKI